MSVQVAMEGIENILRVGRNDAPKFGNQVCFLSVSVPVLHHVCALLFCQSFGLICSLFQNKYAEFVEECGGLDSLEGNETTLCLLASVPAGVCLCVSGYLASACFFAVSTSVSRPFSASTARERGDLRQGRQDPQNLLRKVRPLSLSLQFVPVFD